MDLTNTATQRSSYSCVFLSTLEFRVSFSNTSRTFLSFLASTFFSLLVSSIFLGISLLDAARTCRQCRIKNPARESARTWEIREDQANRTERQRKRRKDISYVRLAGMHARALRRVPLFASFLSAPPQPSLVGCVRHTNTLLCRCRYEHCSKPVAVRRREPLWILKVRDAVDKCFR